MLLESVVAGNNNAVALLNQGRLDEAICLLIDLLLKLQQGGGGSVPATETTTATAHGLASPSQSLIHHAEATDTSPLAASSNAREHTLPQHRPRVANGMVSVMSVPLDCWSASSSSSLSSMWPSTLAWTSNHHQPFTSSSSSPSAHTSQSLDDPDETTSSDSFFNRAFCLLSTDTLADNSNYSGGGAMEPQDANEDSLYSSDDSTTTTSTTGPLNGTANNQAAIRHNRMLCRCTCLYNIALIIHLKARRRTTTTSAPSSGNERHNSDATNTSTLTTTTTTTAPTATERMAWYAEASVLYQEVFFHTLAEARQSSGSNAGEDGSSVRSHSLQVSNNNNNNDSGIATSNPNTPPPSSASSYENLCLSDTAASLLLATTLNIIACETELRGGESNIATRPWSQECQQHQHHHRPTVVPHCTSPSAQQKGHHDDSVVHGWKAVYTDLFVWATSNASPVVAALDWVPTDSSSLSTTTTTTTETPRTPQHDAAQPLHLTTTWNANLFRAGEAGHANENDAAMMDVDDEGVDETNEVALRASFPTTSFIAHGLPSSPPLETASNLQRSNYFYATSSIYLEPEVLTLFAASAVYFCTLRVMAAPAA